MNGRQRRRKTFEKSLEAIAKYSGSGGSPARGGGPQSRQPLFPRGGQERHGRGSRRNAPQVDKHRRREPLAGPRGLLSTVDPRTGMPQGYGPYLVFSETGMFAGLNERQEKRARTPAQETVYDGIKHTVSSFCAGLQLHTCSHG